MYTANDTRDLEMVAEGKSSVADFNTVVARCLLVLEGELESIRKGLAEPEYSVTPESQVGQILLASASSAQQTFDDAMQIIDAMNPKEGTDAEPNLSQRE